MCAVVYIESGGCWVVFVLRMGVERRVGNFAEKGGGFSDSRVE